MRPRQVFGIGLAALILPLAFPAAPAQAQWELEGYADCNNNGIGDDCDIACQPYCDTATCGTSLDCDGSGVPDECETAVPFIRESGQLLPFAVGQDQTWTQHSPQPALMDPVLIVGVRGEAAWEGWLVRAVVNGTDLGVLPLQGIAGLPDEPKAAFFVIEKAAYNALIAGRDLDVRVSAEAGGESPAPASVEMELACTMTTDCNGNGALDMCDIWGGLSQDCDLDTIPDECELDSDGDGVHDPCDVTFAPLVGEPAATTHSRDKKDKKK